MWPGPSAPEIAAAFLLLEWAMYERLVRQAHSSKRTVTSCSTSRFRPSWRGPV